MEKKDVIDEFIETLESKKNNKYLINILKNIKEYIELLNDKCSIYDENHVFVNKKVESISEFIDIIKKIIFNTQYNKLEILKSVVDNITKCKDIKNILKPIEKNAPKEVLKNIEHIYNIKKNINKQPDYNNKNEIWNKFISIKQLISSYKKSYKQIIGINDIYAKLKKKVEFEIFLRAAGNRLIKSFFDFADALSSDALSSCLSTKEYFLEQHENLKDLIEKEQPSLFVKTNFSKNNKLINNERSIYKDFLASNPDKFNNMTTFDILTKMRHYEVPNRLLDVTYDPLLALYFACGRHDKGSKIIFLYMVKDKNIRYYDSDTITILSVLTKLKRHHKEELKQIVDIFINEDGEYYKSEDKIGITINDDTIEYKECTDKIKFYFDQNLNKTIIKFDSKEIKIKDIDAIPKDNSEITVKKFFNYLVSNVVGELNWQLKQEIPSWYEGILDLETFTQCYLVKPKMNNPRIIAQSGAFFIYPFEDTDITKSLIGYDVYQIDADKIKKELDLLNKKETTYMPDDLTKYANEIREKYKNA